MSIQARFAAFVTTICLAAGTVLAHGGQYRGPSSTPGVPSRPVTPGSPVAGGPTTGGNANLDINSWQVWWQLNHPRFVGIAGNASEADRRDKAMPALQATLADHKNPDVLSATLIAMGKATVAHPTIDPVVAIREHLPDGNADVREAAILALGLSGRPEAVDDLTALLHDERPGRKLVERSSVDERARTFAAYGLGLLAQRTESPELATKALSALIRALEDKGLRERDVLTGVLNGMRLVGDSGVKGTRFKRLRWQALDALITFQKRRMSSKLAVAQSHAMTAMAMLARGGSQADRERVVEVALDVLTRRRDAETESYVSAVIALGELLRPTDTEALEVLVKHVKRPKDSLIPKFAMIAFGQIGGEVAFEQLRDGFVRGKRDLQPWAALGLGLHVHETKARPAPAPVGTTSIKRDWSDEVESMLGAAIKSENRDEMRAAIALGLGLSGTTSAAETLRKMALETKSELHKGHLVVALSMLEDKPAIMVAEEGMETVRDAVYFGHCALALAEYGRRGNSSWPLARLQNLPLSFNYVTWLAASAQALGHLKNAADLPQLIATLQARKDRNRRRTAAGLDNFRSAFAAAAIGSVVDRDPLGFGARIAHGMNYTVREQTISNGKNGILDIF
jgi:HEAT repeat protein